MRAWLFIIALVGLFLTGTLAFAQEYVEVPITSAAQQAMALIASWGGLSVIARVSGAIALIISLTKVSFLRPYLWDSLGKAKAWAGPILGLAYGVLQSLIGKEFNWAEVLAYIVLGGGATIFHELLDTIKAIPGVGGWVVTIIELIKSIPKLGSGPTVLVQKDTSVDTVTAAKAEEKGLPVLAVTPVK